MTRAPEKQPEKWCESESEGGGVATGESGQAGRKEGERQRKGKEEAGVLNKQNK